MLVNEHADWNAKKDDFELLLCAEPWTQCLIYIISICINLQEAFPKLVQSFPHSINGKTGFQGSSYFARDHS